MAAINIWENIPVGGNLAAGGHNSNTLYLYGVYIDGSISFNNVAIIGNGGTATLSFGLYSLNGASISIANSASGTLGGSSYKTLAVSTAVNILPGNWYLGFLWSSSANSFIGILGRSGTGGQNGGVFVDGFYSASTSGLPTNIATSDLIKHGSSTVATSQVLNPYILIAA